MRFGPGFGWLCLILGGIPALSAARPPDPAFYPLMQRLVADGHDSAFVAELFQDERTQFIPRLVELNLRPREVKATYDGFLTSRQVAEGRRFLKEHRADLEAALQGTGVPPEYAVALLKIESDLGRRPGNNPIFTSFATITLLADSLHWVAQYDTSGGRDLERMQQRAQRRSRWAYKEMNLFLEVCRKEGWHPLEVNGSWAGAFGWAQFLPSSHLRCARDGDGDGRVDPFSLKDAAASLSHYLKEAGWKQSRASRKRALMQYNPSEAYAECILEYARRLQQSAGADDDPPEAIEAAG
ncbi:MAG: hypothetical protein C4524_14065 [Candidatus Zixiibacteriota bacterium]|nr:MAG: hypothetical protein C4524_14065 [candidate division Zixibacteria bacterium]